MAEQLGQDEFELVINFHRAQGDPARVFKCMAELIEALNVLDRHLISAVDTGLIADLRLSDIAVGSLRSRLRSVIKDLPDAALANANWKEILGHYLVKTKYLILDWCSERDAIESREDVRALENELLEAAELTDVEALPAYAPMRTQDLLNNIGRVQDSLKHLEPQDDAEYRSSVGNVRFNNRLFLSPEIIRDVLTREILSREGVRILKVKKPDYLGKSMWSLLYDEHAINASILDNAWLARFQARQEEVLPGDSIKGHLVERIYHGYGGEIVHRDYKIMQVIEIIRAPAQNQLFRHERN